MTKSSKYDEVLRLAKASGVLGGYIGEPANLETFADMIAELQRSQTIDEVLELLRIHPPHRIGEAAFMQRLIKLKGRKNASQQ